MNKPTILTPAAEIISKRIGDLKPKMAIVLGSGLGPVANEIENPIVIPYSELPLFNVSHIEGHAGQLSIGILKGVPTICMEGRTHLYEGENCVEVIKNIVRTFKSLGCEILFTTNAVGSLNKDVVPGDLVLIKDHINFSFANPLIGRNDDRFGDRFVSMDNVYDKDLRQLISMVAKKIGIRITEGIFLISSGPTFETHAEIRAYKMLGADIVGMSTVPEVIVARHCGMKVVSVSAVTNLAAGLSDEILSHEGTLKGAKLATDKLINLILGFSQELGEQK